MEATQTTRLLDFTARESDILHLLAHAYTRKQIAATLGIRYSTVDSHMYSIFKKTGAHEHVGLILYAQRNGFGTKKQSPRITEGLSPSMLNPQKLEALNTVAEE